MLPDWRGTAVCIASGPSLTEKDCESVRASGFPTIVTNTTFRACPWAQALFGYDAPWWRVHLPEVKAIFPGRLFCPFPTVRAQGVEWARVESFGMSGTGAISFAIAAGARRVIALGYDCQLTDGRAHHYGDHPPELRNCTSLPSWPAKFARLARFARKRGAMVLNASRETALTCFDRAPLESCL